MSLKRKFKTLKGNMEKAKTKYEAEQAKREARELQRLRVKRITAEARASRAKLKLKEQRRIENARNLVRKSGGGGTIGRYAKTVGKSAKTVGKSAAFANKFFEGAGDSLMGKDMRKSPKKKVASKKKTGSSNYVVSGGVAYPVYQSNKKKKKTKKRSGYNPFAGSGW